MYWSNLHDKSRKKKRLNNKYYLDGARSVGGMYLTPSEARGWRGVLYYCQHWVRFLHTKDKSKLVPLNQSSETAAFNSPHPDPPNEGGFQTVGKTREPQRTYQQRTVLTSLTPSCLWRSGGAVVPWESRLVFLDRHASISQAKGTVKLPRKWAPLSKPASLCFSIYVSWKRFHLRIWSL